MVNYHLGKHGQVLDKEHPYKAFLENIDRLKKGAHLLCTNKELDRYLWLAGLYREWQHDPAKKKMNVEVAELFNASVSVAANDLAQLWPGVTVPSS
ncbi:hypothetical protein KSD_82750 [Ktedonobacter sp. SOSP1-85]|nr:hypothetical protein KSD_82750 [Ktedonobacter sp. SOSP1-85]